MDLKGIIESNSFIKDLVQIEAKVLLQDLQNEYLHVILIPAPNPQHTGHMIRKADCQNPEWYKGLYWASGETWKRNHTKKFLKQISEGILNFDSIYVQKLLYLILARLEVI